MYLLKLTIFNPSFNKTLVYPLSVKHYQRVENLNVSFENDTFSSSLALSDSDLDTLYLGFFLGVAKTWNGKRKGKRNGKRKISDHVYRFERA